jgi:hypothetical protein
MYHVVKNLLRASGQSGMDLACDLDEAIKADIIKAEAMECPYATQNAYDVIDNMREMMHEAIAQASC